MKFAKYQMLPEMAFCVIPRELPHTHSFSYIRGEKNLIDKWF